MTVVWSTAIWSHVQYLRDMVSTARLYPGGRIKIIELKAFPPVEEKPPMAVTIDNCAVMLNRYLLTARELEIIFRLGLE